MCICSSKESGPVFFIENFAQHIMHVFSLWGELSCILGDVRLVGKVVIV
jgi:hypothetical protein